jgi:hypothetical protein
MDFPHANEIADRISRGENGGLHKQLVLMCTPYLLCLRVRFGFWRISAREVRDELAAGAVSDSIIAKSQKNISFLICLHNSFRDCCRQRNKSNREQDTGFVLKQCAITDPPFIIGVGPRRSSLDAQVQQDEERQLLRDELQRHDPFSINLIYEKMRGATIPEMAESFNTPYNECKRVYWHDFNSIRASFRQRNL